MSPRRSLIRWTGAAGALGLALAVSALTPGHRPLAATTRFPADEPATRLLAPLASLVPAGDALSAQDLRFDARFAALSLDYLRTGDPRFVDELALQPAAAHLLAHARNFDYDVPKDSARTLVGSLLAPAPNRSRRIAACRESLAFFTGPMLDDPRWVADALRYLPADFRFKGSLFLTFGYDIGVAYPPNASLNGAHPHFEGHPRELLYYAIHELHHAGFMSLAPPPRVGDLKTCRDLLGLVAYSTQLEGMAVLAAWERRRAEKALEDDPDYAALEDEARMRTAVDAYIRDYDYLQGRRDEPLDAAAWAVIDRMSSGERLWYRVGALMARHVEERLGRGALVDLIHQGPARFVETALPLLRPAAH